MSLHESKRIQEQLKSVADPVGFLVNLFEHAPVGFAVWNAQGHTLLTNQAFFDLFLVEPPPEYNVLKDELLAANGMLGHVQRAFAGETVQVPPFWYDPRDLKSITVVEGRRVAISMTIFPLFKPNGEIDFVAATYKDETEVALARELEAFSDSVAHDLHAPLRSINGFTRAFLEDHGAGLADEARRKLGRVVANAQRMEQMIDALLSLAKLNSAELRREPVDLSRLARAALGQLAVAEPEREVEVVVADGLVARGDPGLLRAALDNLLGNAWKFTRGQPKARIELGAAPQAEGLVYFVRDNGAGFEMAYAKKLFSPFQRMHSAEEFEGTGVGLATVARIIRRHGGRVWADATLNGGATFSFTLPG